MFYYLVCFTISTALFWLGQYVKLKKNTEPIRWIIYGTALLFPSILAGLRDVSVGTDMLVYGIPIFKSSLSSASFSDLLNSWDRIEPGYLWLSYIVAGLTRNHTFFFFLIMFIEVLFVFLALLRWQKQVPIWLGMLIFFLLFYNNSLNMMRQHLSLSIGFYGIQSIIVKKHYRALFWILLASQFHNSALILLMYYPLWWFVNKFPSIKTVILFCGVLLFSVFYLKNVLADYFFLLGGKWQQASWYFMTSKSVKTFPLSTFVYYIVLVTLSVFNRKRVLTNYPKIGNLLYYIMAILVAFPFFGYFAGEYSIRFFDFVTFWLILFIPMVFYSIKKFSKPLINVFIISYCLFYWIAIYMVKGTGETQNYIIGM